MKVIKSKVIKGCLEGDNVREFLFDNVITMDFVYYLEKLGKLILYDEIEKSYFKIIVRGQYTVKSSLGNKTIRIILPKEFDEVQLDVIKKYIEVF